MESHEAAASRGQSREGQGSEHGGSGGVGAELVLLWTHFWLGLRLGLGVRD